MREVVSRLQTEEGQVAGQDIQIGILPVTPETGLDRIEKLLEAAGAKGWQWARSVTACTSTPRSPNDARRRFLEANSATVTE